jgi:hypothetical protein
MVALERAVADLDARSRALLVAAGLEEEEEEVGGGGGGAGGQAGHAGVADRRR